MKFRIKLKDAHKESGLSPWAVAKKVGLAQNTVRKYVESDFIDAEKIDADLIALIEFCGRDWRDPSVIEVLRD
jgi:hypothetical protein